VRLRLNLRFRVGLFHKVSGMQPARDPACS
jgi:hypothetical protein